MSGHDKVHLSTEWMLNKPHKGYVDVGIHAIKMFYGKLFSLYNHKKLLNFLDLPKEFLEMSVLKMRTKTNLFL